jgi:glycosidase
VAIETQNVTRPIEAVSPAPSAASDDPLWYKDAVIYQVHVKSFFDSNNDGIGDFPGLTERLDYLQGLGVTCVWILPFCPSPLKDDGYDIADYLNVHPSYGTLDDFRAFVRAAHERHIKVLIELVVNHTSDQHPWFQRARHAPKDRPSARSTSGTTTTRSSPRRGSSSPTPRSRTGRTTRSPASTTGTASSRTSPI